MEGEPARRVLGDQVGVRQLADAAVGLRRASPARLAAAGMRDVRARVQPEQPEQPRRPGR